MNEHHVLVVEDDLDIRESLLDALEDHGVSARGAANGRDALVLLEKTTELPCLILLDLMMPVMDGRAFRRAQVENDRLADIPVVVLSAFSDVADSADEFDAAAVLKKPLRVDEFLRVARSHCPSLVASANPLQPGNQSV